MEVDGHRLVRATAPAAGGEDSGAANRVKFPGWVVKYRWWIAGTLIVFYLLAFTGEWRIGRDSALYRGLGHTLASGHGFNFSEFGKRQIYPGMPLLLAGLEKLFGTSALAPILVMHALAIGCLVTTYKLVSLRYAQWLAIVVTALVGFNGWFMELTNEILTDVPFLFGLLLALYGWERLRIWGIGEKPAGEASDVIERASRHPWVSLTILLVGLALAALMRPTFWIVGVAWVMVCAWGLIVGPGKPARRFYLICLGVLALVWVAVLVLDPRTKGFNPLGGGYEREARHRLEQVRENVPREFPKMLGGELAYSFFGSKYGPVLTEVLTALVLASSLMLLRVNPLWTLLILLTVATTLVMTTVPRYYTMVLPLLLLGWMLLAAEVARRLPVQHTDLVLILAVALVFVPNVARLCKVIGEQRHLNREAKSNQGPKWKHILDMSNVIRRKLPPGTRVIGPGATIMSYASERQVLMWRDLMPDGVSPAEFPDRLAKANVKYAIFPPTVYRKGENWIRDLMEHGVIVPTRRIGRSKDMVLAQIEIRKLGPNWMNAPLVDVMTAQGVRTTATATQPAVVRKRPTTAELAKRTAQNEREKRKLKAKKKLAAYKKKRKATRAAATAPATQPALLR
ncbi:MAG TPA: hypothetical protein VF669_19105 [Tepidisphaeraceae bacterium]|jgi:hypothetical protein